MIHDRLNKGGERGMELERDREQDRERRKRERGGREREGERGRGRGREGGKRERSWKELMRAPKLHKI